MVKKATQKLNMNESMMLTSSNWGPNKTFKMIPVNLECPYTEAIFDPGSKILAIVSKVCKQQYHMIPKLDDNGDPQRLKINKREDGKDIKEERRLLDTFAEYYITDEEEIELIVEGMSINSDTYDWKKFFTDEIIPDPKALPKEKATMVNLGTP